MKISIYLRWGFSSLSHKKITKRRLKPLTRLSFSIADVKTNDQKLAPSKINQPHIVRSEFSTAEIPNLVAGEYREEVGNPAPKCHPSSSLVQVINLSLSSVRLNSLQACLPPAFSFSD